jgi:hypothetical protein
MFQEYLIWGRYECPKFWDNKSPNFGILFEKKCHLYVALIESCKVDYGEGSGASS